MSRKITSRNLNIVDDIQGFIDDTLDMDFDVEDLVDYSISDTDTYYWLNIESVWGKIGFEWLQYENYGNFLLNSKTFDTLPRIPDPHRIKKFERLFDRLGTKEVTIYPNDWDHITTIGNWGNGLTVYTPYINTFPNLRTISQRLYKDVETYYLRDTLGNINWSNAVIREGIEFLIDKDNHDLLNVNYEDVLDLSTSKKVVFRLRGGFTNVDDCRFLTNVPSKFPQKDLRKYIRFEFGETAIQSLYEQEALDEDGNTIIVAKPLYINTSMDSQYSSIGRASYGFTWNGEGDNPPIFVSDFYQYSWYYKMKLFNCTILPSYKSSGVSDWTDREIPWDYNIFQNPNHKVRVAESIDDGKVKINCGYAFRGASLNYSDSKKKTRWIIDQDVFNYENNPRGSYADISANYGYSGNCALIEPNSVQDIADWHDQNDDPICRFSTYEVYPYNKVMQMTYSTLYICDTGNQFINGDSLIYDSSVTLSQDRRTGDPLSIITSNSGISKVYRIHYDGKIIVYYGVILVEFDCEHQGGALYISSDTTHVIKVNNTTDQKYYYFIVPSGMGPHLKSGIFDLSEFTDGDSMIKANFSLGKIQTFLHLKSERDLVERPYTTDLAMPIVGVIFLVHKSKRPFGDLGQRVTNQNIWDIPVSKILQIGCSTDQYSTQLHLEGGYVFSLNDEDTESNPEGVQAFIDKIKHVENPSPKSSQLYLDSEGYSQFTQEQIEYLNNIGWEVIEVIW